MWILILVALFGLVATCVLAINLSFIWIIFAIIIILGIGGLILFCKKKKEKPGKICIYVACGIAILMLLIFFPLKSYMSEIKYKYKLFHPETSGKENSKTYSNYSSSSYSSNYESKSNYYSGSNKSYSNSNNSSKSKSGPLIGNKKYYSNSKSKSKDPYDVDEFEHAEDFYEFHYDDFIDYEEAEDYYNEHSED